MRQTIEIFWCILIVCILIRWQWTWINMKPFFFSWWVLSKREIYIVEGPKQYKSSMDLFSSSGKARGSKSPLYLHLRAHLSSTLKKKGSYICAASIKTWYTTFMRTLFGNDFSFSFSFFIIFFKNFVGNVLNYTYKLKIWEKVGRKWGFKSIHKN